MKITKPTLRSLVVFTLYTIAVTYISYHVGFVQGAGKGYELADFGARSSEFLLLQHEMELQEQFGNCTGYKQAILNYLAYLENTEHPHGELAVASSPRLDGMLAHAKLALVERHLGNEPFTLDKISKSNNQTIKNEDLTLRFFLNKIF